MATGPTQTAANQHSPPESIAGLDNNPSVHNKGKPERAGRGASKQVQQQGAKKRWTAQQQAGGTNANPQASSDTSSPGQPLPGPL